VCRRHAGTRARRGRRALRMARINAAAWAPSLAGGRRAWRCPTCSRDSSERSGRSARSGKLPQSRRSGRACAGTQSIPACEEPESGADAARGSQHTAPSCRDTAAPPALITCASLERLLSWDLANFLGHARRRGGVRSGWGWPVEALGHPPLQRVQGCVCRASIPSGKDFSKAHMPLCTARARPRARAAPPRGRPAATPDRRATRPTRLHSQWHLEGTDHHKRQK